MVHALEEASRVVSAEGVLLDLRPLAIDAAFEVTSPQGDLRLGELSGAPGLAADFACRRAIREALERGWFAEDSVKYLRFSLYWDSPVELMEFWGTPRSRREVPPAAMLAEASSHLERPGDQARVRVQEVLRLARYRKRRSGPKVD